LGDVALLALGLPDDPLVGDLLGDGGFPVAVGQEDLGLPVDLLVGLLLDALHLAGEVGVVTKPGPLIVGDPPRQPDIELLDDGGHLRVVLVPATLAVAGAHRPLHLLLRAGHARAEARLERGVALGELLGAGSGHLRAGPAAFRGIVHLLGQVLDLAAGPVQGLHHECLEEVPAGRLELIYGEVLHHTSARTFLSCLCHSHSSFVGRCRIESLRCTQILARFVPFPQRETRNN
jgi:hypothetical protein